MPPRAAPAQCKAAAGREVQWLLLLCSLRSSLLSPLFLLLLLHPPPLPTLAQDPLLCLLSGQVESSLKNHTLPPGNGLWSKLAFTQLHPTPPSSFPLSDSLFLESQMLFACTYTDTCPDKPPTRSPPGMPPGLCPRRRSTSCCPGGPALRPGFFPSDAWQSGRGQGH